MRLADAGAADSPGAFTSLEAAAGASGSGSAGQTDRRDTVSIEEAVSSSKPSTVAAVDLVRHLRLPRSVALLESFGATASRSERPLKPSVEQHDDEVESIHSVPEVVHEFGDKDAEQGPEESDGSDSSITPPEAQEDLQLDVTTASAAGQRPDAPSSPSEEASG